MVKRAQTLINSHQNLNQFKVDESWRSNASESCNSHQLSSSFDRTFSLQLGHRGPIGIISFTVSGEILLCLVQWNWRNFLTVIDMRIKNCIYNLQVITVQSKTTMSARAADMLRFLFLHFNWPPTVAFCNWNFASKHHILLKNIEILRPENVA